MSIGSRSKIKHVHTNSKKRTSTSKICINSLAKKHFLFSYTLYGMKIILQLRISGVIKITGISWIIKGTADFTERWACCNCSWDQRPDSTSPVQLSQGWPKLGWIQHFQNSTLWGWASKLCIIKRPVMIWRLHPSVAQSINATLCPVSRHWNVFRMSHSHSWMKHETYVGNFSTKKK